MNNLLSSSKVLQLFSNIIVTMSWKTRRKLTIFLDRMYIHTHAAWNSYDYQRKEGAWNMTNIKSWLRGNSEETVPRMGLMLYAQVRVVTPGRCKCSWCEGWSHIVTATDSLRRYPRLCRETLRLQTTIDSVTTPTAAPGSFAFSVFRPFVPRRFSINCVGLPTVIIVVEFGDYCRTLPSPRDFGFTVYSTGRESKSGRAMYPSRLSGKEVQICWHEIHTNTCSANVYASRYPRRHPLTLHDTTATNCENGFLLENLPPSGPNLRSLYQVAGIINLRQNRRWRFSSILKQPCADTLL